MWVGATQARCDSDKQLLGNRSSLSGKNGHDKVHFTPNLGFCWLSCGKARLGWA